MQWSTEPQGGFTAGPKPILPVIADGPYGFEHVNVAEQRRHPGSLLNWTERIIRARKEAPEIGWGDFAVIRTRDPAVLALRYDWRGNSVLVLHNLDSKPHEVKFRSGLDGDGKLIDLLGDRHDEAGPDGRHRVLLEGYGYRWFRVGGLGYILRRREA